MLSAGSGPFAVDHWTKNTEVLLKANPNYGGTKPSLSGVLFKHVPEPTNQQFALEKGDKRIVGVNCHKASVTHDLEILRVSHEVEVEQVRALAARRSARDEDAVTAAVQRMVDVSRTDENMIEAMLDAVRVEASLGEICDALRAEWGEYREPARF